MDQCSWLDPIFFCPLELPCVLLCPVFRKSGMNFKMTPAGMLSVMTFLKIYSAIFKKKKKPFLNRIFFPVYTLMESKKFSLKLSGVVSGKTWEESRVPILCFYIPARLNLFLFSSYFLIFFFFYPIQTFARSVLTHLSQSVLAAITNYHQLGGLNNKQLFLTVLDAGSWRSRLPQIRCLGRGCFLVCTRQSAPCILPWPAESRELWSLHPLLKGTNPIYESPTSWSNYFQKAPSPNTITLGIMTL